ncbi:PolC-type DNA polymerase III [Paenisporosarcina cavernae]|uniref:3'-5' exonuclease n=1 Tax=Paenisporosarcina cavernae TaxID=2320858 RepID=A0A385YQ58_9BACL|nr:exonuclease domain-containing protein [Paenisporosarcina cavernae]AYC28879.1 3'-5' exonuclease [Paenisporosarcina cavernae]
MDDQSKDPREYLQQKSRQQYWASRRAQAPKKYKPSVSKPTSYVVLDFETTGFRPGADQIIQVGAIKFLNHEKIDEMNQLVNPRRPISSKITALTGIHDAMVRNSPTIATVLMELIEFIGDLPIIAHNASFDMGFLYAHDNIIDIPSYTVIDTVKLARKVIQATPNHKLTTLSNYLELEHNAHDALGDCIVTAKIYQYCLSKL